MGNKVIIEGLKDVVVGLNKVISALDGDDFAMDAPVVHPMKSEAPKAEPVKVEKPTGERADELNGMKYNELKKLASELGVSAAGKRDDLIARIISAEGEGESTVVEQKPEKKPVEKPTTKKAPVKKAEPDEYDELAKEVLEENGEEAVIEELADHDIKATKKNVLTLLAKALRDGVIDLEDDEDDEDDVVESDEEEVEDIEIPESDDDEGEDVTADTYFADFDEEGVNDPKTNSKTRLAGMKRVMQEQIDLIEGEEIDASDMKEYVQELSTQDEQDEQRQWGDDDFVAAYLETKKRMVDEDGDEHEPSDAYMIGEDYYCCGHKLVYDAKSKEYICPVCEQTYEA